MSSLQRFALEVIPFTIVSRRIVQVICVCMVILFSCLIIILICTKSRLWLDLCMHISNRLVLVVLLLYVFLLLCFLCFYCSYVFIDVRLSHLNKDYLLTYLLSLTVFTERNFVADFLQAKCNYRWKTAALPFSAPFGGLGATYDDHLKLIRKRVVDFLLALIELFSLGVTADALRANISSNRRFRSNGGAVDLKFQGEGVAPTNHSFQKTRLNDLLYGIKIRTNLSFILS